MAGLAGQGSHHCSDPSAGNRAGHCPAHAEFLSPAPVHRCHFAVVRGFSLLCAPAFLLGRTPHPVSAASPHRPDHGHAGGLCHRRRGQFPELLLSPGHYRGLYPVAADLGLPDRGAGVHPLCGSPGTDVFRSHSFVFQPPIPDWELSRPSFSSICSATWQWRIWRDCWRRSCTRSM